MRVVKYDLEALHIFETHFRGLNLKSFRVEKENPYSRFQIFGIKA